MGAEAYADVPGAAMHDPDAVHAMCEDYRAGLAIDGAHDDADRAAGRRVAARSTRCGRPRTTRTSTATRSPSARLGRRPARHGIDSGHHMAEEAPEATAQALAAFWAEVGWA